MPKKKTLVSVVINTLNEEKNIKRCLKSVGNFADEIIVVDMHSEDKTVKIAEDFGAKVYQHERTGYVEPARNFAIGKAEGKWILVLDADEKLPKSLAKKLTAIAKGETSKDPDCVLIPRKNIILGKWMKNSRWWPDYLPRFFKRGKIDWPEQIHQQPSLSGKKIYTLPDTEKMAIIHYNYESLNQFLERNQRYAKIQALELVKDKNYQLSHKDLIISPLNEFLSRFFAGEAYKDGTHGLALSLLQAWVNLLTYLKVWEHQNYEEKSLEPRWAKEILAEAIYQMEYWRDDFVMKTSESKVRPLQNLFLKIRQNIIKW
jgi:glycosyltransferase involved in cell wall biosynthesis